MVTTVFLQVTDFFHYRAAVVFFIRFERFEEMWGYFTRGLFCNVLGDAGIMKYLMFTEYRCQCCFLRRSPGLC